MGGNIAIKVVILLESGKEGTPSPYKLCSCFNPKTLDARVSG